MNSANKVISIIIFVFIFYLIVISTLLIGCTGKSGSPDDEDDSLCTLLSNEWCENISKWLELSYIETADIAGFSTYPSNYLEDPDLYTTHAVLIILTQLHEEDTVQKRFKIAEWVNSIQDDEGSFSCPGIALPSKKTPKTIVDTYKAIKTLISIDISIPNKDAIITFLLSTQEKDGLFRYNLDPKLSPSERIEQKMVATNMAITILDKLGFRDWNSIKETTNKLQEYIDRNISSGNSNPDITNINNYHPLILAIQSLTLVNHSLVSEQAKQFLLECIKDAPFSNTNILTVSNISDILNTCEMLEITHAISENSIKNIQQYLEDSIFPQQLENGMFVDPLITSYIVTLANQVGLPIPNKSEIVKSLDEHRIEAGWVPFVSLNINNKAQNTYYAIYIAKKVGFSEYNPNYVNNYLIKSLVSSDDNLQEVYYALMGYKLINKKVPVSVFHDLKDNASSIAGKLTDDITDATNWAYFKMISEEVGFNIPEEMKYKMNNCADAIESAISENNVYLSPVMISILDTIQENSEINIDTNNYQLEELILSLLDDSGGFKTCKEVSYADIHSTYLAIKLLQDYSYVDKDKLLTFILSCKSKYGFNYISQHLPNGTAASYIPDLRSTFEAMTILTDIDLSFRNSNIVSWNTQNIQP